MGSKAGPYREQVDAKSAAAFCAAVGAPSTERVPGTYLTRLRRGEFELFTRLGIDLSHILHGEQEYSLTSEIRIGAELEYTTVLTQSHEKHGASGKMRFLTFETKVATINPDGETHPLATSRTLVITR